MKTLALYFLAMMLFANTYGQKLPNVQKVSLRAPANIKIDGKLDEWGDKLQAYNKVAEIFYTIANDDDNLYLVVQVTDGEIAEKIMAGGLALTINPGGKKKDKNGAIITFPAYEQGKIQPYLFLIKKSAFQKDTKNGSVRIDSLRNAGNEKIKKELKFIGVAGIKDVAEGLIPIYNSEGLMTAALLDDKVYYNFELSIPIKLLNTNQKLKRIAYNIKLNGYAFGGSNLKAVRDKYLTFTGRDGKEYMIGEPTPHNWSLATATDFWGEYILAK